jgi:signal transduction histidine kinase
VQIHLSSEEDRYSLSIEDDGKGFDPKNRPRGLGLLSIQERIEEMSGTLHLISSAGRGTRISVEIPVVLAASAEGQRESQNQV